MKIKFRALCLTALVVVLVFTSAALAATTQFLGVDGDGDTIVITVDPEATNKITYEGYTITGAPNFKDNEHLVRMFGYEGGIVAVDITGGANKVHTFKLNDEGKYEFVKTYEAKDSAVLRNANIGSVTTLQGNPVLIAPSGELAVISNDTYFATHISPDAAFTYNSNLYVIGSVDANWKIDGENTAIVKLSGIANGTALSFTKQELKSSDMPGLATLKRAPSTADQLAANVSGVMIGNTYYLASVVTHETPDGSTLAKISSVSSSGTNDDFILDTNDNKLAAMTGLKGKYYALFDNDGALFALESADSALRIVKITDDAKKIVLKDISSALGLAAAEGPVSLDVYFDTTTDVIGVISHATINTAGDYRKGVFAVFTPNENEGWDFVASKDFKTAAMIAGASKEDEKKEEETKTTTVVDASTLATASQDNLVAATPATAISEFVTATEASTSTVPTGAQAAIEALLKTDDKTTVTLAAKTNYTPAKGGYLLVKEAVDVSKVRVYFVEAATTTAATGDLTAATFLDADCKEMGSTGTSVYAASDKLESGKTYTLVEATVSTSSSGDDGDSSGSTTSSSSGGCDAGFGLWAAAALMAVTTISKRR